MWHLRHFPPKAFPCFIDSVELFLSDYVGDTTVVFVVPWICENLNHCDNKKYSNWMFNERLWFLLGKLLVWNRPMETIGDSTRMWSSTWIFKWKFASKSTWVASLIQFLTSLHFISSNNLQILKNSKFFSICTLTSLTEFISSNHEGSSTPAGSSILCCRFWTLFPSQRYSPQMRTRFRLQILGPQLLLQVLHRFLWRKILPNWRKLSFKNVVNKLGVINEKFYRNKNEFISFRSAVSKTSSIISISKVAFFYQL